MDAVEQGDEAAIVHHCEEGKGALTDLVIVGSTGFAINGAAKGIQWASPYVRSLLDGRVSTQTTKIGFSVEVGRVGNTAALDLASIEPSKVISLLEKPKTVKHHIFNKFRGESEKSQKYREFFKNHNINIDAYTVEITESLHKKYIHAANNNWTSKWKIWINNNPNASTKEVYQYAGKLMDEHNISHVPIIKYK